MYVSRLSRFLLTYSALALLASCTGGSNGGPGPADSSSQPNDGVDAGTRTTRAALQPPTLTACFYAALPGAFRVYCPGPKRSNDSCQSLGAVDAKYEVVQNGSAQPLSVTGRALSNVEAVAVPDACVAFDLPLLPNSDHRLNYTVGAAPYLIVSYLRFADGTPP